MDKREYSLLYRLLKDPNQYQHAHSLGGWLDWCMEQPAAKALNSEYGYGAGYRGMWRAAQEIYQKLCSMPRPQDLYTTYFSDHGNSRSILFDCYTHDGERLKRTGWISEWKARRLAAGKPTAGLYLE